MATEAQPKPRIPFAASLANRDNSSFIDARLVNGFLEKSEDKAVHAYRRPGMSLFQSPAPGLPGRGIYNWLGDVYAIFGDKFYKNGVDTGFTITDNGKIFSWTPILGLTRKLFFHNGSHAYNWDGANLVTLVAGSVITGMGTLVAGSPLITGLASTAGLLANTGVEANAGLLPGAYILTVDSGTQVTLNSPAQGGFTGVTFTFTTPGFPSAPLVPGIAYLDATAYVMTTKAVIFGSNINDTSSTGWESMNFLTAQIEPDDGVCLAKQLVYVIAFKQWSTEFFYDAGNAVGSPLASVQGNKISQGCRDAGTVASLEGDLIWVSTTREGNVDVYFMSAARANPVGTPAVERLIQKANFTGCYSFAFHMSGHKFYVVTLPATNLTLVFDTSTREWYKWTDTNGNYWPYVSATISTNQQTMLQHESSGNLHQLSPTLHTDNGQIIPWDLYTPNWDGGARMSKILSRVDFIGDQTPGTIVSVSVSDDDYKSWSQPRIVDMGKKRPNLRDCGTFRRRAWHLSNRTDTFLRIQAAELHVTLGTD